MTQEEIVTALIGEWEVPSALCDILPAAADLIENQQRHIEALMKANAVLQRDEQMEKLAADRKALINELCQYCGKYKQAHKGACDRCRWKQ